MSSNLIPWLASDIREHNEWTVTFDALEHQLPGDDDDPDQLRDLLSQIETHVLGGEGFLLIRGLLGDGPTACQCEAGLRRVSGLIGTLVPQDQVGTMIRVLVDDGDGWMDEQPMHTDAPDILALAVVRSAQWGGQTKLASGIALYEYLANVDPATCHLLQEPWKFDRKDRPGPPTFQRPIFAFRDGQVTTFFLPGSARDVRRHGIHLTTRQLDAITLLNDLAQSDAFCLRLTIRPGDILLVNNAAVLHGRSEYRDDPDSPRVLLRSWIATR